MAQIEIPIRLRFIRIPVTWEAVSGTHIRGNLRGSESPDQVRVFELDSWQCREDFFRLSKNDVGKLTEFLNKYGIWSSDPEGAAFDSSRPLYVEVENVWEFRDDMRLALSHDYRKYFIASVTPIYKKPRTLLDLIPAYAGNEFPLSFELSSVAAGTMVLTNAKRAILASLLVDIVRGIRFKNCARKDCGVPFPVETKHQKIFCSQYCGHLVSLRRKRSKDSARKRKARKSQHLM